MICTSINHCEHADYQLNYIGDLDKCILDFVEYCSKNDVIWARLFKASNGELIYSYSYKVGE